MAVKWLGPPAFASVRTTSGQYWGSNGNGSISVGYDFDANSNHFAALWDSNGEHKIASYLSASDIGGWSLDQAKAVSDDGKVVVGNGTHAGHGEGWVVHLP